MTYNSTFLNRLDIASFISSKTESSPSKHSIKTLCFPFHISECKEYPILGKLSFITLSTTSLYPINLSHKIVKGHGAMSFAMLFSYFSHLFIKLSQIRQANHLSSIIINLAIDKHSFYSAKFMSWFAFIYDNLIHISYSNKYSNLSKV